MRRSIGSLAVSVLIGCGRLGFAPVEGEIGVGVDGGTVPDGGAGADGETAVDGAQLPPRPPALAIPGGLFLRDNTWIYEATISPFWLDRDEVTVERFRVFVEGGFGTRAAPPPSFSGEHPEIEASGWKDSWNMALVPSTIDLVNGLTTITNPTFTPNPGTNEQLPVVGITWYEAFAFCAWDGGRLPTVAEHEFAAFGGDYQLAYPWGAAFIEPNVVMGSGLAPVGSRSPHGDARWGHADLVGNADEWGLDFDGTQPMPCMNCANLTPASTPTRVLLGGSFQSASDEFRQSDGPHGAGPGQRNGKDGFRCARDVAPTP